MTDYNVCEVFQDVAAIGAPKIYLQWLQRHNADILNRMPEARHLRSTAITRHLLNETSEDVCEMILQVCTLSIYL